MSAEPSEWQKKIEGEWHGRPGLFDAEGNHVGYERIAARQRGRSTTARPSTG